MDPFSHAMVGGTAAVLLCRKPTVLRAAALCGVLAGMAPDLDVLLRAEGNPMFGLKYHRFFTHALAFAPLGALMVAGAVWPLLRKHLTLASMVMFCFVAMCMHGVLDAMTNYGTHLFWPFTPRRESWNIISIIDPIFTLTLAALLLCAVWKRARKYAVMGAVFALSYWAFGLYQREQATDAMRALAHSRGHAVERYEVKPAFANVLLWRGQYLHAGNIYYDAFHVSPWRGEVIYAGGSVPVFTPPSGISKTQQQDLKYFTFFSDGWLAYAPSDAGLIGDMRFSMLPNASGPIWGIRLQQDNPQSHVAFENIRNRSKGDVMRLWTMIKGEPLPE